MSIVQSFSKSSSLMRVVSKKGYNKLRPTVLILDSSFNPPHKAHESIVYHGISHYNTAKTVILMLSVKNADKTPQPASFEKRLEMMELMAESIQKNGGDNVSVWVCLSKLAKFTDKQKSLYELGYDDRMNKAVFLVGYDTLIRILDLKYYEGEPLSEALGEMMQNTDLFCLSRGDDYQCQLNYVAKIQIPDSWRDKIVIMEPKPEFQRYSNVSSSDIRKQIMQYYDNKISLQDLHEYLAKSMIDEIRDKVMKDKTYYSEA